jgi:RNA polymerase sigma-70 factor (ECF subfamily)
MGDVISIRRWPGSGSATGGQPDSVEGEPPAPIEVRLEFLAHEPALRRRAVRLAPVRDVEHLVRDSFELLLCTQADRRPEHLAVWLYMALGHLYVRRCQQRLRLVRHREVPPEPMTPPRWALTSRARFAAAVDLLPPEFRRVFVLHAVHGLSYDQIAAELGVSRLAVFARLFRARLLLKDMLADLLEAEGQQHDRGV